MAHSVTTGSRVQQVLPADSTGLSLRECLRLGMDLTKWNQLALATYLRANGHQVHDTLPAKWLSGERPVPARIIDALPRDLRVALARVMAEAEGLHVVDSLHVELANQIAAQLAARRL